MSKVPSDRAVKKFSESQIGAALKEAPEWSELSDTIQRTFQFPDFVKAMAFVNEVARMAEADQHHPDILVRYNKVTLTLSTHDAGGITKKDFVLAKKCDAAYEKTETVSP
jgi:4a-hydroxytetrahydrobiopterin dehydratase